MNVDLDMAKGMFFDVNAFLNPVDKAKQKILIQFGAYCKAIAKNSIKTGAKDQHSAPGEIPVGHDGKVRYKDFIHFFHDKENDTVVIGAVLLPRKDRTIVPGVLERGGQVEHTKFQGKARSTVVTMHQPRPHMQRAFDKTVAKNLDKLIENSIVKE